MPRKPERADSQRRRLANLTTAERRAISRAVNRGWAVGERRHAGLAVAMAERQQRFWRLAWLVGPFVGLAQIPFAPIDVVVANGVASTAALALICVFWFRRARRAEQANRELQTRPVRRQSHTPRARDAAAGSSTGSPASGARPPRPRGRKRR